jgi:hypothetical protein
VPPKVEGFAHLYPIKVQPFHHAAQCIRVNLPLKFAQRADNSRVGNGIVNGFGVGEQGDGFDQHGRSLNFLIKPADQARLRNCGGKVGY